MALYMVQVAYTPEAWASILKNPQDRTAAVEPAIQKLGGRVEKFWLSFGEYDVIGVIEMPDNAAAAAISMAFAAGGACKSVKTTPLLTFAESLEAMKRAASSGYRPPA